MINKDPTHLNQDNKTLPNLCPLVVDLDGTLIQTDILHESIISLLKKRPWIVLVIPYWLFRGKAFLKRRLARYAQLDVKHLPYNEALVSYLKEESLGKRKIVLCTASDMSVAQNISAHLRLFDEILASDGQINLAGKKKAAVLNQKFGEKNFDYVGNSMADLAVWKFAKRGLVVSNSKRLIEKIKPLTNLEKIFVKRKSGFKSWVRALRLHQWVKNVLVFVPFFAAHQLLTLAISKDLVLAFFAFGFCASSVYIANDLLDLDSDRQHPRKCARPFASGMIELWQGAICIPILLGMSLIFALQVQGNFLSWLLVYFGLTCAYSWGLKKLVLVDCFILAILYTIRILAGATSVSVPVSFWLIAFSIFLFLSLAFIKRYAELRAHHVNEFEKAHGRGYYKSDNLLIEQLGIASGFSASLVLALYLNGETVIRLYKTPEIIWIAVPIMLLWLSWIWLQAHRGLMHDDPIVFAIKDRTSIFLGLLFASVFILARVW